MCVPVIVEGLREVEKLGRAFCKLWLCTAKLFKEVLEISGEGTAANKKDALDEEVDFTQKSLLGTSRAVVCLGHFGSFLISELHMTIKILIAIIGREFVFLFNSVFEGLPLVAMAYDACLVLHTFFRLAG